MSAYASGCDGSRAAPTGARTLAGRRADHRRCLAAAAAVCLSAVVGILVELTNFGNGIDTSFSGLREREKAGDRRGGVGG